MTEEKTQLQAISKLSVIHAEESLPLEQCMYFECCMDFLVKMMEKYGGELKLPRQKSEYQVHILMMNDWMRPES